MTILIIERNKLVRNGLIRIIDRIADSHVCENAQPDGDCKGYASGRGVDVIVFSMGIPTSHGLKDLANLRTRYPKAKIVALSIQNDNQLMKRVMSEGVSAIVSLDTAEEELTEAVKSVMAGKRYISSQIDWQREQSQWHT